MWFFCVFAHTGATLVAHVTPVGSQMGAALNVRIHWEGALLLYCYPFMHANGDCALATMLSCIAFNLRGPPAVLVYMMFWCVILVFICSTSVAEVGCQIWSLMTYLYTSSY